MSRVPARIAEDVRRRAKHCCEYCQLPAMAFEQALEVEHIIPVKHGGKSVLENLALACKRCNLHKGTNLSGMNDDGRCLVRLFHPRMDVWSDHFVLRNGLILGKTDVGSTTVRVLALNVEEQAELRLLWQTLSRRKR